MRLALVAALLSLAACKSAPPVNPTRPVTPVVPDTDVSTPPPETKESPESPKDEASDRPSEKVEATEPEVSKAPEPEPEPEPPAPAPVQDFKVLILGDSMAATDFGRALEDKLAAHEHVECARRGKSSTGLARPDYFDWMAEGAEQVKKHNPDFVIVIVGGNDGQDLIPPEGKGRRIHWKSDRWAAAYGDRIRSFVKMLADSRRKILWLELPVMDHRRLEGKLEIIRAVQQQAFDGLSGTGIYLKTRERFVDDKGQILRKVRVDGWKSPQDLRQKDGIHFTVPGSRYFADFVAPRVLELMGLGDRRDAS